MTSTINIDSSLMLFKTWEKILSKHSFHLCDHQIRSKINVIYDENILAYYLICYQYVYVIWTLNIDIVDFIAWDTDEWRKLWNYLWAGEIFQVQCMIYWKIVNITNSHIWENLNKWNLRGKWCPIMVKFNSDCTS